MDIRLIGVWAVFVGVCWINGSCHPISKGLPDPPGLQSDIDTLTSDELYIIEDCKKAVFMKCLEYGFANREATQIINNDVSLNQEFILGEGGNKLVDSVAMILREIVIQDSIRIDEFVDLKGKKAVFTICLNGYTSTMVDSVARDFVK